jgi:hypothetical protein
MPPLAKQRAKSVLKSTCCPELFNGDANKFVNKVRFHLVEIIELSIVLGDNPACSGAPLSCGWDVIGRQTMYFLSYENERQGKRRRRSRQLLVPSRVRSKLLLQNGFDNEEIEKVIGTNELIQLQRRETVQQSELQAEICEFQQQAAQWDDDEELMDDDLSDWDEERPAMSSSTSLSSSAGLTSSSSSSSLYDIDSKPLCLPTRRESIRLAEPYLVVPTRRESIVAAPHQPLYCPIRRESIVAPSSSSSSSTSTSSHQPLHRPTRRISLLELACEPTPTVEFCLPQRAFSDGILITNKASPAMAGETNRRGSLNGSRPLRYPTRRGSAKFGNCE